MNFDSGAENVYIHVPFCASKCGYCAFYSLAPGRVTDRQKYLEKITADLAAVKWQESAGTVYVGGGTPDFLTAAELTQLTGAIAQYIPRCKDCEVTFELNPECLTAEKLEILSSVATRLSLGVQSFDAEVRRKLMRHCSDGHLYSALELLKKHWRGHFNIDLIYGVSGVDWELFESDLRQAVEQGVDHLSCYSLTPEENSALGLKDSPTADDDVAAGWWLKIGETLSRFGLNRYEVSNYARPGAECRHNCRVWEGGRLLALGPAGSGFDGVDRYSNIADLEQWLNGTPPEIDHIDAETRRREIWAVNLRTVSGWSFPQWEKIAPGTWERFYRQAQRAAEKQPDWWQIRPGYAALTEAGLLFWDEIAMDWL